METPTTTTTTTKKNSWNPSYFSLLKGCKSSSFIIKFISINHHYHQHYHHCHLQPLDRRGNGVVVQEDNACILKSEVGEARNLAGREMRLVCSFEALSKNHSWVETLCFQSRFFHL